MYVADFTCNEDVAREYMNGDEEYKHILKTLNESTVYMAWYGRESYEGQSFVLFEHGGILYEVNGSHCSCYGLEGQWAPEETNWKALKFGRFSDYYDESTKVQEYLNHLCKEHIKE